MGTVVSEFPGPVTTVFLLAENRLLREALLRILAKKDDIRVVGSGSYEPDMFEHIVTSRANVGGSLIFRMLRRTPFPCPGSPTSAYR